MSDVHVCMGDCFDCMMKWNTSSFSSSPGYAGWRYAHGWGLLPDCVGEARHGLPDSWGLLWKGHLSLSGLHEASEHMGHAAGPQYFTEGSDHISKNLRQGELLRENQSQGSSHHNDVISMGTLSSSKHDPQLLLRSPMPSAFPPLQCSVWLVVDLEFNRLHCLASNVLLFEACGPNCDGLCLTAATVDDISSVRGSTFFTTTYKWFLRCAV